MRLKATGWTWQFEEREVADQELHRCSSTVRLSMVLLDATCTQDDHRDSCCPSVSLWPDLACAIEKATPCRRYSSLYFCMQRGLVMEDTRPDTWAWERSQFSLKAVVGRKQGLEEAPDRKRKDQRAATRRHTDSGQCRNNPVPVNKKARNFGYLIRQQQANKTNIFIDGQSPCL